MRKFVMTAAAVMAILGATASSAVGASNPNGTGQPGTANLTNGASCGNVNGTTDATQQPPGFLTTAFANATLVYAGGQNSPTSGGNSHAISEYDIACYQFTTNH